MPEYVQGLKGLQAQEATKGAKWDGDGIPIEDTNMAGVGGDEDKAIRKAAAGGEPAWEGVGLEPGVWVWRIEAFKVVAWPKEKYGKFHEGDSYIVLQTEFDTNAETGEPSEKLQYDIHFWLGKKTSTDEKGTAAYKTVELDSFFDDQAIQHREVQGSESDAFHSYFGEVTYLPGGVDSGFKVTQVDTFINKLTQVRRNANRKMVFEEEQVARSSLNHRDAFILEHSNRKIYVWVGDNCSPFVKQAANSKAEQLESMSDGEMTVTHDIDADFWEAMGGEGEITAADAVGEEVEADFGEGVLYAVQVDEARKLTITEVGRGELDRDQLDSTAVMMVDTRTEIFLWLGKDTTKIEKASAFLTASNYLKMNGRDVDKTAITVLKEGTGRKNKAWSLMFPVKKG